VIPLNSAMKLQVVTCLQYRAVAACEFSPGLEDRWARFVGPLHSLQLKVVPFALIQIQRKFYEQHLVCVAFFFFLGYYPRLQAMRKPRILCPFLWLPRQLGMRERTPHQSIFDIARGWNFREHKHINNR